jgi:hypothetical protein
LASRNSIRRIIVVKIFKPLAGGKPESQNETLGQHSSLSQPGFWPNFASFGQSSQLALAE